MLRPAGRFGVLAVLLSCGPAVGAGPAVDFDREVRPILSEHCYACHGPDAKARKADLRLDARADAFRDRSGYAVIVPGNAEESELVARISSGDADEAMPPPKFGKPLSPAKVATLRRWIEQGAAWDAHWSYKAPARPPLPAVKARSWPRNDLDAHVLARIEAAGLAPSPEADRATLIRRASLDLTGLPPSPEEVSAFLDDDRPDAYERVVDRLLASPHYGERQARPWLDQARYADTNGYEKDERRSIWPYRDWVIDALNRDMPFDAFTVAQLAGDLLPGASEAQRIATGFHRNTMVNTEGGTDDEEFRVAAVVDRVNTTMQVWMGSTFACAQCHDHKYDPFSQKDYFQIFAFFNTTIDGGRTTAPTLSLPTPAQTAEQARLRREIDRAQATLDAPSDALAFDQAEWEFLALAAPPSDLPAPISAILRTPAGARSEAHRAELDRHHRTISPRLKPGRDRLAALRKQADAIKPATTMVLKELGTPRPSHVLVRGSHNVKGEPVVPGTPGALHPLKSDGRTPDRRTLARWLVDPENPLVGRVIMNRAWAQYFGRGIVETSEDFGMQGEQPTNPALLDSLAVEFVARGWSLKAMHRLIATSAAYRQTSRATPDRLERDPDNRLYSRGPRFRMEAEMVRDQALAVGGLLSRKVGGPSVFPHQPEGIWFAPYSKDTWVESTGGDQYRRGLYTFWRRSAPYPMFTAFDAPSREVCAERRPRTNTPLQALATLNDPAFVQPAAALARRIVSESRGDDEHRASYAMKLVLSRSPSPAELGHLVALYRENLDIYRRDLSAAKSLAASGLTAPIPDGMDPAELAAWVVVGNVLLNLDEAVTKG